MTLSASHESTEDSRLADEHIIANDSPELIASEHYLPTPPRQATNPLVLLSLFSEHLSDNGWGKLIPYKLYIKEALSHFHDGRWTNSSTAPSSSTPSDLLRSSHQKTKRAP
jgi:hypothetical protein